MKTQTADRWLNAPYNAYVRYTHEITEIEKRLVERYGWFFDDTFFYWQPKQNQNILKRAPLWMYPQKGLGGSKVEKHKYRFHEKQTKLVTQQRQSKR